MFCLAAGASGAVLLFQAQQHANTGHNQQHANAAEQQGAETTGGGQVEALAVDDICGNRTTGQLCCISSTFPESFLTLVINIMLYKRTFDILLAFIPSLTILKVQVNFHRLFQQVISFSGLSLNQIIGSLFKATRRNFAISISC